MYAVCVEKTYLMCKALLKAIRECMHGCEALILHAFITISDKVVCTKVVR